eukprot:TRINITY_DN1937_c0_g1_i1.p2 TRINITY_DN1937_c0_g1~~TRINITY_DN1937_c0_g1_i1.p2  ORF type:complete len:141 (+),score=52.00 TRINITY_DN1937_c0_g1_i1:33-425(+)
MCIRDNNAEYMGQLKKIIKQIQIQIMGGKYRRKRQSSRLGFHRERKTKHYSRDIDQIYEDIKPENSKNYENLPFEEDKPGFGQFYCIPCAKHFINERALSDHQKEKTHKVRVKKLKEKPYTIEESLTYGK